MFPLIFYWGINELYLISVKCGCFFWAWACL